MKVPRAADCHEQRQTGHGSQEETTARKNRLMRSIIQVEKTTVNLRAEHVITHPALSHATGPPEHAKASSSVSSSSVAVSETNGLVKRIVDAIEAVELLQEREILEGPIFS